MRSEYPRRFRNPYLPVQRVSLTESALIAVECVVKGNLFACSMCGNCVLQETAFICPLRCPKGLRNGPCGSGSLDHCCVDSPRPCVWQLIYRRAETMGRLDRLREVQAPLDWSRVGRETWGSVLSLAWQRGLFSPRALPHRDAWRHQVAQLFYDLRQPAWWRGDSEHHPPRSAEPVSRLQARLARGEFVVTAEIAPPLGASPKKIENGAAQLHDYITAGNFTENPMATARMSSLACSALLLQQGIEPVMQMTARDYNRLSLQSEILGASALGIRNVLCLTGDPPMSGREPFGAIPFDVDAVQMLWILRRMRDEAIFLDGRPLKSPPPLFLGVAGSPGAPNLRYETLRLEKKIRAGAQFIQTQLVYNVDAFTAWMEALDKQNLLDRVHILAGVGPLRSAQAAHYVATHLHNVCVPAALLTRMENAHEPREEGIQIALEVIERLRRLEGVSGIHLMSMGWESVVPRIVADAGLLRKPPFAPGGGELTVTRTAIAAGDPITVKGEDVGANEEFTITLEGLQLKATLGKVTSDPQENFQATFAIPATAPTGDYQVKAVGKDATLNAELTITASPAPAPAVNGMPSAAAEPIARPRPPLVLGGIIGLTIASAIIGLVRARK
jgi:methylenetetrahydrofolate reductase (NADPH)